MAVICKTSKLGPGWCAPGDMYTIVEAALLREVELFPDVAPDSLRDEIANSKARIVELAQGITIIGGASRLAGFRDDRRPGMRDPTDDRHPLLQRMALAIHQHEPTASPARVAQLVHPTTRADLLRACVYRFAPLTGAECALDQIYQDASQRLFDHVGYAGEVYDMDHCTAELMRQVIDVTLLDWFKTLDDLREQWPDMFEAAWTRDAARIDRLLRESDRELPSMPFLRMVHGSPARKLRALCGIFWEMERLFELLHAFAGLDRVTPTKLRAALNASTFLGIEIARDSRTARYLSTSWCHRNALIALVIRGPIEGHDPRHPHIALGDRGRPTDVDEASGIVTDAGIKVAADTIGAAPPFAIDQRLRRTPSELPAHYFAGREPRSLAILFLLEVRQELGKNGGSRGPAPQKWFELRSYAAIGRLAMVITSNICSATAQTVLNDAVVTIPAMRGPGKHPTFQVADFVANPIAWHRLFGGVPANGSAIARRSNALGGNLLGNVVDNQRPRTQMFIVNDSSQLGHSLCFRPSAWFEPLREVEALVAAWKVANPKLRAAFPGSFDDAGETEVAIAGRAAARLLPAAIDMWQDPHCRKSDRMRASERLAAAQAGNPAMGVPPKAPPSAAARFAAARYLAGQIEGARLNRTLH